jgi:hypothetical protein
VLSWPVALALAVGFCVIYIPVIASEERFLRATFPSFEAYCSRVPRLIPRLATEASRKDQSAHGAFSFALYSKHREYNASIGAALLYLSLFFLTAGSGCNRAWATLSVIAQIQSNTKEPLPDGEDAHDRSRISLRRCPGRFGSGPAGAPLPPPRAGYSFPQKQTLIYTVDWRVFPAGTAVLHFEATGDRERITANADTIGAINLLFHVGDRFQSTFDRVKGCTYEFDKQTVEGHRQINSTLKLDYAQGKSILDEKNLVTGQSKHVETGIPGCLSDLLTGVYYAASQPMQVGKSFVIPVVDAQRNVPVTMKVEGREVIKTTLGTFNTLRVQPTAEAGVVKNRGNIWIWYTDDERHLPVQMRARLFWGTITFRLTGNENK